MNEFITVSLLLCVWAQVLLVTASRNQQLWIVPGGGIEPTEDPRVAALREVEEEAGAKGILGRCLGVFEVLYTLLLHAPFTLCSNVYYLQLFYRADHIILGSMFQ